MCNWFPKLPEVLGLPMSLPIETCASEGVVRLALPFDDRCSLASRIARVGRTVATNKSLVSLSLSNNMITSLPAEIGETLNLDPKP